MSAQRVSDVVGRDSFIAGRIGGVEPDQRAQTIECLLLKRLPRDFHRVPPSNESVIVIERYNLSQHEYRCLSVDYRYGLTQIKHLADPAAGNF